MEPRDEFERLLRARAESMEEQNDLVALGYSRSCIWRERAPWRWHLGCCHAVGGKRRRSDEQPRLTRDTVDRDGNLVLRVRGGDIVHRTMGWVVFTRYRDPAK